ncbi:MAG: hypothetical protein WEA56_00445 [Balneolaceae bacterium]
MGQQQLLLVILVTIIVGIATVVAINVFGTSAASANVDAVRNDVLGIASSAQGWYIKPTMMGGGGNSFGPDPTTGREMTFADFNFSADSISTDGLSAINMNGKYVIVNADQSFTITAHPASDDDYDASAGFSATASDPLEATVTKGSVDWTQ